MSSNDRSEPLDLARGLPTSERDIAVLRGLRYPAMSDADFIRLLATLTPADHAALAAKRGPRGVAFRLSGP
jgi:hypothetical protein